jgi:hypothetical protein
MFKKGTLPPQPSCDLEQTLEVTVLLSLSLFHFLGLSLSFYSFARNLLFYMVVAHIHRRRN